ncbi:uncharacterized protein PFL1_01959 [Pseudozyma flocculosa PF-1]|uniref:uncharacterized protein n=1 Tax=Pseudozyma flocculosa PF-1 TaxID=1277687 RepID=UPI00045602BD|nr:uncharacterized protein PFL1_01959 [Pseudozyma flocculosa PF-1]EPQ30433.1 hypothetical protein PFL1_01959 [Pseudozyma flocculosa PF-1]
MSTHGTNALDGAAAALPPLAGAQLAGDDKHDGGFNATFGLNPMSADDPSWIGHGFQAQAAEDFLSSPEWTDPSPALTDSMSFDLDSYDGEHGVPGIAGAPLFSPMDGYASSNVSPFEASHNDFGGTAVGDFGPSEMGPDFTLFPEAAAERKRPAEMAFSQAQQPGQEDLAVTLLRALSSAALQGASVAAPATSAPMPTPTPAHTNTPAHTTSPLLVSSDIITPAVVAQEPPTSAAPASSTAPASAPAPSAAAAPAAPKKAAERATSPDLARRSSSTSSGKPESRGTKRRFDPSDLLPLDAPIQPRKYHTVSATSRRDTPSGGAATAEGDDPFADEEAAIRKEKDPRVAKRLSNTLAARRSRHRKAEELRTLHETIDSLRNEVEMWKKRCERAEKERDEARA